MKILKGIVITIVVSAAIQWQAFPESKHRRDKERSLVSWPQIQYPETRPWTWWWWHGSAADTTNIANSLEAFHKAGIGGVNIVCPLSVIDETAPEINFLSKQYVDLVTFTVRKAHSLGMGTDIAPVSGWAFGGPAISKDNACSVVMLKKFAEDYISDRKNIFTSAPEDEFSFKNLESVLACSEDNKRIILTDNTREDGTIDWQIPEGEWTFYVTCNLPGSSEVRLPSPDQQGYVVDHLKKEAVQQYLSQFTKAFEGVPKEKMPRAYNIDSWEINLDWTKGLFDEFLKRRGYDLELYIPELFQYGSKDLVKRVICDYRETLSDLLIDNFTKPFDDWTRGLGGVSIAEVLSEPCNILDANALIDIPQMDLGSGLERYIKEGRYIFPDYDEKCAASAAHILGKKYVASETFTCLGPVLNTPLELLKEKVDYDFVAGVNHTCYHGIAYSPASAHWPGWLFFAGTHLGEFNPQWQQMGQVGAYIARNQSFLQKGRQDNDLLFYLPYYDIFSRIDTDPGKAPRWWTFIDTEKYPVSVKLMQSGCDLDFVSDKMLQELIYAENGKVASKANQYKAIVVADCHSIPVESLQKVIKLAEDGATVLMIGDMPSDVPGLHHLALRQEQFNMMIAKLKSGMQIIDADIKVVRLGSGKVIFGDDVKKVVAYAGIHREIMKEAGLEYTRRRDSDGWIYFISNPAQNKAIQNWIPLSVNGKSAALFDAMSGLSGMAAYRIKNNTSEIYLQLEPRESIIVKVFDKKGKGPYWKYRVPVRTPIPVNGKWIVTFMSGGEAIPHPENISELTSWTKWESDQKPALKGFSGVARYATTFQKPLVEADDIMISLGEVCHTARVYLNGKLLGDMFSRPMMAICGVLLKEGTNVLEIEVANTPINRIADMDIRGIDWYYKTPDVDLSSCEWDFKKIDSTWIPQPSGLIGPVELVPVKYKKIE